MVKELTWEALHELFLQFFPRKSLFIITRESEINIQDISVISEELPRKIAN